MSKHPPVSALPLARFIIDKIGRDEMWHALVLVLSKQTKAPMRYVPGTGRQTQVYKLQFFSTGDGIGGTDARIALQFDLLANQIMGTITHAGGQWKISEDRISMRSLPSTLLSIMQRDLGPVSKYADIPVHGEKQILAVRKSNSKLFHIHLDIERGRPELL